MILFVFATKNKAIHLFLLIEKYYIHLQGEFKLYILSTFKLTILNTLPYMEDLYTVLMTLIWFSSICVSLRNVYFLQKSKVKHFFEREVFSCSFFIAVIHLNHRNVSIQSSQ